MVDKWILPIYKSLQNLYLNIKWTPSQTPTLESGEVQNENETNCTRYHNDNTRIEIVANNIEITYSIKFISNQYDDMAIRAEKLEAEKKFDPNLIN